MVVPLLSALATRRAALAAPALALLLRGPGAAAQGAFPDRPLRLIIPFPPGGSTGSLGRILAEELGKALGQTVVVDNRGGAAGAIGAEAVARARADGYTLLFGTAGTQAINPAANPQLAYDPVRDFAPIAATFVSANVVLVHPSHPARTLSEFLAGARAAAQPWSFASGGTSTTPHMTMEMLRAHTGITLTHVPYRGSGPMLADLIAGHVTIGADSISSSLPYIRAGTLRALGISSRTRSALAPELPTISETVPDFEVVAWWGLFAPVGTPVPIVAQLNAATNRALAPTELRVRLAEQATEPLGGTPAELGERVQRERAQWAEVITRLGLRFD